MIIPQQTVCVTDVISRMHASSHLRQPFLLSILSVMVATLLSTDVVLCTVNQRVVEKSFLCRQAISGHVLAFRD